MNIELFEQHIRTLVERTEKILLENRVERLVIGSGEIEYYFADDRPVYFKSVPHFAHWCPLDGPGHLVSLEAGKKPKLIFFAPDDFWHLSPSMEGKAWLNCFEVVLAKDKAERFSLLGDEKAGMHFIGFEKGVPENYVKNDEAVTNALNWNRSYKTDWEIHCLDNANRIAAKAHLKAKDLFLEGCSEHEIFFGYMQAAEQSAQELPYNAIIGLDEHAATLHYEQKLKNVKGTTLLIDAGANYFGYASDITRTVLADNRRTSIYGKSISERAHQVFSKLLYGLDDMQVKLVEGIEIGQSYVELHKESCLRIFDLLKDQGIITKCPDDLQWKLAAVRPFFPHGLGHMLGLQVHDVAGKQVSLTGDMFDPSNDFPSLRNYRVIENGHVFTVEPGIYFIPTLIEKFKGTHSEIEFDYDLIEELYGLGGIRIEDNIYVKDDVAVNVTRKYLPR